MHIFSNTTAPSKSFAEHKEYLHEIVKLQLWFLWHWKQKHQDQSISSILRNRVDIYRKTNINEGTLNPELVDFEDLRWVELEQKTVELYDKYLSLPSLFERQAFSVFKPEIDARAERDFDEVPYVFYFKCGSLTFDPPKPERPNSVFFHVANAISPRSFLEEKKYILDCFMCLLNKSASEYNVERIETTTWLNSYPKWLHYFPEEWNNNMSEPDDDVMWHYGFWGQFITKRGLFDARLGKRLRETGAFPFLPCHSACSIASMKEHVFKCAAS
jgi:hypothetical protein